MKRRPGRISGFALDHLLKKPSTVRYPMDKLIIEPQYRGRIIFDHSDCIGCNLCSRDCPSEAIKIINIGTKEDKKFQMDLDLGKCIFCGQCADSCPKKCITVSSNIELAAFERKDLKLNLK